MIKKILGNVVVTKTLDILFSPLTLVASYWFKYNRMLKPQSMPITEAIFMKTGTLPVRDHYYQPLINPKKHLTKSLREDRSLPGIDWNVNEQLEILDQFDYRAELLQIPVQETGQLEFFYDNGSFIAGDAEYLYSIIRLKKPGRIIEIGCGYSTLMIRKAIEKNKQEYPGYQCRHICIEPYEMTWLEKLDVEVIRKKVEDLPVQFFGSLQQNDILFIDSSHIIRPQGDVLFEFLEVLPVLNPGVLVHVHDIFSPKDYLDEWVYAHKLWNEQYLLEAYLSHNKAYKIIGALNFIRHHHTELFTTKCLVFSGKENPEPGSFWIQKVS